MINVLFICMLTFVHIMYSMCLLLIIINIINLIICINKRIINLGYLINQLLHLYDESFPLVQPKFVVLVTVGQKCHVVLITSPFSHHHGDGAHGLPPTCKQSASAGEEHGPIKATLHCPNNLICLRVGSLHGNFGWCASIRIGMCEQQNTHLTLMLLTAKVALNVSSDNH